MTSNQTPKYSIGQEVYGIVVMGDNPMLVKGIIYSISVTTTDNGKDKRGYVIYCIQTSGVTVNAMEYNVYATKEDIIKDLP